MSKRVARNVDKLGEQHYRVWWTEARTGTRRSRVVHGTLEQAKALEAAKRDAQTRGEYVAPDKVTLAAWLDRWLERREIMGGKRGEGRLSTQERYRELLSGTLREHLGHIPLQELTVDDLEDYYVWAVKHEITQRGRLVNPETVKKRHKVLKLALEAAVKRRVLTFSPADYADTPAVPTRQAPVFTRDDAEVLLAALHGHWLELPATIALHTGARLGEVLALRWSGVEWPADDQPGGRVWLTIDGQISEAGGTVKREPWAKTRHSVRRVALTAEAAQALNDQANAQLEWCQANGLPQPALVCATLAGGPRRPSRVTAELSAVIRWLEAEGALSTSGATFHTLRHTQATWLREQGVPIEAVAHRLGHSRTSTTQDRYVHFGDRDETAAEALEGYIGGLRRAYDAHEMHIPGAGEPLE